MIRVGDEASEEVCAVVNSGSSIVVGLRCAGKRLGEEEVGSGTVSGSCANDNNGVDHGPDPRMGLGPKGIVVVGVRVDESQSVKLDVVRSMTVVFLGAKAAAVMAARSAGRETEVGAVRRKKGRSVGSAVGSSGRRSVAVRAAVRWNGTPKQ